MLRCQGLTVTVRKDDSLFSVCGTAYAADPFLELLISILNLRYLATPHFIRVPAVVATCDD